MSVGDAIMAVLQAGFYVGGYILAGWLGVATGIIVYWLAVEFVFGPALIVLLTKTGVLDQVNTKVAEGADKSLRRWGKRAEFIYGIDR